MKTSLGIVVLCVACSASASNGQDRAARTYVPRVAESRSPTPRVYVPRVHDETGTYQPGPGGTYPFGRRVYSPGVPASPVLAMVYVLDKNGRYNYTVSLLVPVTAAEKKAWLESPNPIPGYTNAFILVYKQDGTVMRTMMYLPRSVPPK